jgi:hypothetical protein
MQFVVSEGDGYPSVPLNPVVEDDSTDVRERGRLKFSADSLDFFSEDGAGIDASNRIRGIVLHDIMSSVAVPSDLETAVMNALNCGEITEDQVEEVLQLLEQRISEAGSRGWFPSEGAEIMNEVSLIDTDGQIYRPDRVVKSGDRVIIIDYKFGEHYRKYEHQMKKYAELWFRMGYPDVSAFLWYVQTGDVVAVK